MGIGDTNKSYREKILLNLTATLQLKQISLGMIQSVEHLDLFITPIPITTTQVGSMSFNGSEADNSLIIGSANWWNAAKSIGFPVVNDPEAGNNLGIFWIPNVLDATTSTRSDARINHYDRVQGSRPNYQILASTTVSRVLFNGTRAIGVEHLPSVGGDTTQVYATKEVILAAGGIHTPQVLQLSGIGPQTLLNDLGIAVVQDLPGVGQNLQDQTTLTINWNCTFRFLSYQEIPVSNLL